MDKGLVKLIRKNLGVASILAVSALSGCGGGGGGSAPVVPTPVNLTSSQIVTNLQNNGFICSVPSNIEVKNNFTISNVSKCLVPSQNAIKIGVLSDTPSSALGVKGANPITGPFNLYTGGATNLQTEVTNYNASPQIINTTADPFEKISRIIQSNAGYTQTSLLALINNELTTGTGLKPPINGTFDILVRGDKIVPKTVILGNKKTLPVSMPVGPNYTLQSSNVPVLDSTGAPTGVNGQVSLAGGVLTFNGFDLNTLANGNYTLADLKLQDNLGNLSNYPQKGKVVVNKCPVGVAYDILTDSCRF